MQKMKTLTIGNVQFDIFDDEAVRFTEQELTDEQKAQARENIGASSTNTIEPAEDDIPKVFFGSALPQTKDDTIMSFRYISKTEDYIFARCLWSLRMYSYSMSQPMTSIFRH